MINPPKKVTMDVIREIYPTAIAVHKGHKELEDGVEHLVKEAGMNEGTAEIYIRFFVKLKEGELHQNKMAGNIPATRYFFEKISDFSHDNSKNGLKNALKSLMDYIEYYEGLEGGHPLPGFRAIHEEFSAKLK